MELSGVISEPADVIRETVRELRTLSDLSVARLEADFFLKRGVERSLQICVEAVIDIAHRLVSLLGEPPCASAGTALDTIAARGIIADAGKYRKMIQFRNLVVHRYDAVDNAILVDIVRNHLGDLDSFIAEVAHANLGS
ncbi:MAG: hypothetical protein A3K19_29200 [Lentisphaerae bacterium RIFOXYB12_FULL_65_16]|nr:MAG: hypothetical protein A3K18_13445 [Lentisphaerae bacterium RIFOXYA12_64_32]OGV88381.1 MAG: hypothetical protein A3K19_29200 [Lentisphaerae bacterium RIFOXYB12_FULL_65_16]